MRSTAKINELAGCIGGNGHSFVGWIAVIIQVAALESFDKLDFVDLVLEKLLGIFRRNLLADEVRLCLDQFPHAVLDGFEIIRREGARQVEVVVKPVFDGWTDSNLPIREHFQDGFSHHVGG